MTPSTTVDEYQQQLQKLQHSLHCLVRFVIKLFRDLNVSPSFEAFLFDNDIFIRLSQELLYEILKLQQSQLQQHQFLQLQQLLQQLASELQAQCIILPYLKKVAPLHQQRQILQQKQALQQLLQQLHKPGSTQEESQSGALYRQQFWRYIFCCPPTEQLEEANILNSSDDSAGDRGDHGDDRSHDRDSFSDDNSGGTDFSDFGVNFLSGDYYEGWPSDFNLQSKNSKKLVKLFLGKVLLFRRIFLRM